MEPTVTHDSSGSGNVYDGTAVPQLDGFEFIKPIGRGGMGVVWLATQLATKRKVAVKLLAGHQLDADGAARFRREIELASQLEHPGIARVYDSGLSRGQHFYCMEFVDGLPLNRYAEKNKLSREDRIKLMIKVCEAVQFAHLNGVIHRDLKPSNILVTADGQPHVLDFGLAKLVNSADPSEQLSIAGEIMGTPIFMSPEQAGAKTGVDVRTDVYSLGVMLFDLVTGLYPHDVSGSNYDILKRVIEEEPKSPRSIDRSVDAELEAVLLKALSKDREDRYVSAGAMVEDLQRYMNGEPLAARKSTTIYFLTRRLRRYRGRAAIVALVLMAFMSLGVVSVQEIREQRDVAHANLRQANKNYAAALVEKAKDGFKQGEYNQGKVMLAKAAELDPGIDDRMLGLLDAWNPDFPRIDHHLTAELETRYVKGPIAASQDERYVFYLREGIVIRCRIDDGTVDRYDPSNMEYPLVFRASPSGRYLVLGYSRNGPFRLIDFDADLSADHSIAETTLPDFIVQDQTDFEVFAFPHHESELAVLQNAGSVDPRLVLYRLPGLSEIARLDLPATLEQSAYCISVSPSGENIYIGRFGYAEEYRRSDFLRTRIFSATGNAVILCDDRGHTDGLTTNIVRFFPVLSVACHDDPPRLAVTRRDHLFLYDMTSNSLAWRAKIPSTFTTIIKFTKDGRWLEYQGGTVCGLIDARSGQLLQSFPFASSWGWATLPKTGLLLASGRAFDITAMSTFMHPDNSAAWVEPRRMWRGLNEVDVAVRDAFLSGKVPVYFSTWKTNVVVAERVASGFSAYANNNWEVVIVDKMLPQPFYGVSKMEITRWLETAPPLRIAVRAATSGWFDKGVIEVFHSERGLLKTFDLPSAPDFLCISDSGKYAAAIDRLDTLYLFDLSIPDLMGSIPHATEADLLLRFRGDSNILMVWDRGVVRHLDLDHATRGLRFSYKEVPTSLGYRVQGMNAIWTDFASEPAWIYGYTWQGKQVTFEFDVSHYLDIMKDEHESGLVGPWPGLTNVFVSGEFNGWSVTNDWQMHEVASGRFRLEKPLTEFPREGALAFKFALHKDFFVEPPQEAANRVPAGSVHWSPGQYNLLLNLEPQP